MNTELFESGNDRIKLYITIYWDFDVDICNVSYMCSHILDYKTHPAICPPIFNSIQLTNFCISALGWMEYPAFIPYTLFFISDMTN